MANKKEDKVGFNIKAFVKGSDENQHLKIESENQSSIVPVVEPAPKKTRMKKSEALHAEIITTPPQTSMQYVQENIPYQVAYNETNKQLDDAITQLDMLGGELVSELQTIKSSRTLKNKFVHINNMAVTLTSVIGSKIAAIKEKNKVINDVNNLEIRRIKDLKMDAAENENSDQRIANLYNAFVSMSAIGQVPPNALGPSMQNMMMVGPTPDIMRVPGQEVYDQMQWEQSLDPAKKRMLLEAKGIAETVVVYDSETGNRYYDVIDKTTGQSIPDIEKPDDSTIYELDINLSGMFAKDSNRQKVYRLIVINNGNNSINMY